MLFDSEICYESEVIILKKLLKVKFTSYDVGNMVSVSSCNPNCSSSCVGKCDNCGGHCKCQGGKK